MNLAHRSNLKPLDFARLVSVGIAAAALGLNAGSLARICRETLERQGTAFFVTPPEGGQSQWFIQRSYDPRLRTPQEQAMHAPSDLACFSERQRAAALQRRTCVERLRVARVAGKGTMETLAAAIVEHARTCFPELKISRSRLFEWDRRFARPSDLILLVDQRGGDQCSKASPEAWAAFRDLFLHENQPTIKQCWKEVRALANEKGWGWCSYTACAGQLNDRIPKQQQIYHRTPATYRQQMAPFTAQHPESWRAGELYIGDHKELDLICKWGKGIIRPWLTAWIDWRTRKLVGYVLSDSPNSTTILAALRHALKDPSNMGGPAHVWIDNGKDYDALMFHGQTKKQRRARIKPRVDEARSLGIFNALDIKAHFAIAHNPNGKARLERWFRTLEGFFKTFDTYTGDCIDNKPERLNEILAKPRLIPTFELVRDRLATHIGGYNADTDHSIDDLSDGGETISPTEAYARWCDTKRVMADDASLDLLLMHWHKPTTVGRNGITINLCGQALHYGQHEEALKRFKALKKSDRPPVNVSYDPHALQSIRVFDAQWRFICTAPMNDVGGIAGRISKDNIATMSRNKALYNRGQKHVAEYGLTSTLSSEEQLMDVVERERQPIAEPSSTRIVQTPLDGQGKEVEREQLRTAVGAESMSPPIKPGPSALEKLQRNLRLPVRYEDDALPYDPLQKLREQRS